MHDGVELLNPGGLTVGGEGQGGQLGALDAAIGAEDFTSKAGDHLLEEHLAGLHQLMGDQVGAQHVGSASGKHLQHRAFSAGDSAGQANLQHGNSFLNGVAERKYRAYDEFTVL